MIHLDHAASAPVRREALEAMWPLLGGGANPSSVHEAGRAASAALETARRQVAGVLHARPGDVVFTSGGTEADNLALQGIVGASSAPGPRRIVTTALEHAAVRATAEHLAERHGVRVDLLPVDADGRVDPADLAGLLRPETALVSVQLAGNEVGTVQPVRELARVLDDARGRLGRRVPLHTDAVQAAGWLDLDVAALGVDAMSLAGHKVGAPGGTGCLWVRGRVPLEPVLHGGGQERGRRSGTQNVAGAAAFGAALALAEAERTEAAARVTALRDRFVARVEAEVPGAALTGHRVHRLPGHASFTVAGLNGETLLLELEARGVLASSGSACHAGSQDPSPVLLALGLDPDLAQTAVRFSFGATTTSADLDAAADAFVAAAAAVRALG